MTKQKQYKEVYITLKQAFNCEMNFIWIIIMQEIEEVKSRDTLCDMASFDEMSEKGNTRGKEDDENMKGPFSKDLVKDVKSERIKGILDEIIQVH